MKKKVILLTNLGSPDSTSVSDVRSYLAEFLMDEKVIDIPYLPRLLLVRGIIVPFRAPMSAAKYKTIWTQNGSPLIHITNELAKCVSDASGFPTYVCMRYANPTPQAALEKIKQEHPDVDEVILVPLYPHYAMSSYETAVEHVLNMHRKYGYSFKMKVVPPFYQDSMYIDALASSIKPFLEKDYDHILFSYHGVPERHIRKTDPTGTHCLKCDNCCNMDSEAHKVCYRHQVKVTTELVAAQLNIPAEKYSFSFQSRLGRDAWLKPYTAATLREFPSKGKKNIIVVSPAFVSDCLETLEEIQVEGKEDFEKAGGKHYEVVPCLNTNEKWVNTILHLIHKTSA
ncbi:MAG: ferrochelatase [Chitinophagaceae bacterium]|jgi:ferrochelatase